MGIGAATTELDARSDRLLQIGSRGSTARPPGIVAAVDITRVGMPVEDLGNIGYIRSLWDAFRSGGVAKMAELVPPDVRWRPLQGAGRSLQGTEDLAAFWASREVEMPSLRMFHGEGDDVLVEAEYRRDDGSDTTVWLLYRFQGRRLVEAIGFPSETQARRYSPPPASD